MRPVFTLYGIPFGGDHGEGGKLVHGGTVALLHAEEFVDQRPAGFSAAG